MKISILCSGQDHPVYPSLRTWSQRHSSKHAVSLVTRSAELDADGGDILFLISCHEIIPEETRRRYRACLVVHASDLPKGRGWSPLTWQVVEGQSCITVTLLEAADAIDSGRVWRKIQMKLQGHELCDEINSVLFDAEQQLMDFAVDNIDTVNPVEQSGQATYYPRRTAADSRLDVNRSLAEQFDLLRIVDSQRYPAYFDYRGHRYQVTLKKVDDHES